MTDHIAVSIGKSYKWTGWDTWVGDTFAHQATESQRFGHLWANFVTLTFRAMGPGTEVVPSGFDLVHRADHHIVAVDLVVEAEQVASVTQDLLASHDFLSGFEV